MDHRQLLLHLFSRIDEHVTDAVDGLDAATLTTPPSPGANTIAWLVWHLTRVQDHHVSELLGVPQVYVSGEWEGRFGVTVSADDTGYGHSTEQVLGIRPDSGRALTEYHDAVSARTRGLLTHLTASQLDEIVDRRWDPPVTMGVRLVSVADDDIQHAGQALYVRGLLTS